MKSAMEPEGKAFTDLSVGFGSASIANPYPLFADLRERMPVMEGDVMTSLGVPSKLARPDGSRPVYSIFRYDDIARVLQDSQGFTSGVMLEAYGAVLGRIITGLDGDEHRRLRSLLQPVFTKRSLEQWRSDVVGPLLREEFLDRMAPRRSADLLAEFATQFPVRVIYRILGFPDDPEAIEQFNDWALSILLTIGSGPSPDEAGQALHRERQQRALKAAQDLYAHVFEIVVHRRRSASDGVDLISLLLRAEFEGHSLDDEEITNFVRSLLPAAADTTSRSFANLMVCLLSRPDDLEAVRNDPSLLPGAINESLRYESTLTVAARQATHDVEIRGVAIPAGAGVSLIVGAGNRDPAAYPDPDRFDVRRSGRHVLTFNLGAHICLGIHVAKMELLEAAAAVLGRLSNLRFDPDLPTPQIVGAHFRCPDTLAVVWD